MGKNSKKKYLSMRMYIINLKKLKNFILNYNCTIELGEDEYLVLFIYLLCF